MDDCVNRKTWDPNLLQFSVTHNIHHYGDFHATQWQKNGDNNVQSVKKYFLLIESVI
jgi:predicted nucleotidyltransferase